MGYMIFQYQGQLGFIAREDGDNSTKKRDETERKLANINIHVKAGLYDKAIVLFQSAIKEHPNHKEIYTQCFHFLLAIKNLKLIKDFSTFYFKFLNQTHREDQLTIAYKKILHVHPKFKPITPEDRLMMARECKQSGDARSTVKLLNGIHKEFPDFNELDTAYLLMAEALRDIPKMGEKADSYEAIAKRFTEAKKKRTRKPAKKASLSLADIETNTAPPSTESPKKNDDINYDGGIDFK